MANERAEALRWQEPRSDYVGGDEVTPGIFNCLGENEKYLKDEQDIIKQVKITTEQVQDAVVNITQAEERVNLATTEKVKTTFGKIKKWFSDLRALAFKDKVEDDDIINVNASKVDGLHSVATSGNYTELNNKPDITKEAVGLENVANERQYSTEYPPPYPVTKVNGYIGDVVIDKADVGLSQVADERQYSEQNIPPYPVTSVQGRVGDVSITKADVGLDNMDNVRQYSAENPPPYPVTSVNSKTGAVALTKADVGLSSVANERQYSTGNPPPYPVTSVNGMIGSVIIDSLTIASIANVLYPVGSIKITTVKINPKISLGGDWVEWGRGRVPVGVSSDYIFNAPEKTGGSATHKLSINEMPNHSHDKVCKGTGGTKTGKYKSVLPRSCSVGGGTGSGVYHSGSTEFSDTYLPFAGMQQFTRSEYNASTGGYSSHNNLQPYITCYMWKRTV